MATAIHVVHIISHLWPYGGTAKKYLAWVKNSRFRHTFLLYEASKQRTEYALYFRQAGVRVLPLKSSALVVQLRSILSTATGSGYMPCFFGHYFRGAVLGVCARFIGGYPLVIPLHGASGSFSSLKHILYRGMLRTAHKTIYNSRHTGESFSYLGNYEIIYNGIDYSPIPVKSGFSAHDGMRLLAVGELNPDKNYRLLVEMMSFLSDGFRLKLVGDGVQRSQLELIACKLGVANKVHFSGYVNDAFTELAQADIFLHPAKRESFGMAVLEALFARVPVVVTDSCAPYEIINGGSFGWVGSPVDARAWARQVTTIARNPEEAWAKAVKGREWAMSHCSDIVFAKRMDATVENLFASPQ